MERSHGTGKSTVYIVYFTDIMAEGCAVVADEVTEGNLNPVTSNVVASIFVVKTVTFAVDQLSSIGDYTGYTQIDMSNVTGTVVFSCAKVVGISGWSNRASINVDVTDTGYVTGSARASTSSITVQCLHSWVMLF